MKIVAANVQLESSHLSLSRYQATERFEMWTGERNRGASRGIGETVRQAARPLVEISDAARAAQETEAAAAANDEDPIDADPRLSFLRRIVELLTGRPIHSLSLADLRGDAPPVEPLDQPPPNRGNGGQPPRAGFGIEYDFSASYEEFEQVGFSASGVVRTADGREIAFDLAFEMQRSYSETVNVQLRAGDARLKDPLMLDFGGPASALSDLRFSFDLDVDGQLDDIPLPGGGRGFLAIDRNDNGQIDDGRELFGPTSGDGFAELAALDDDGNGWIDEGDAAFGRLRVWNPSEEGAGSVATASAAGIGALYVGHVATSFELRGAANETLGMMRASGVYLREDGSAGTVSQVDLSV